MVNWFANEITFKYFSVWLRLGMSRICHCLAKSVPMFSLSNFSKMHENSMNCCALLQKVRKMRF